MNSKSPGGMDSDMPWQDLHHIAFPLPDAESRQNLRARQQIQEMVTIPMREEGDSYHFVF